MSRNSPDALKITHPEKILFPRDGITKGDLCAYYEAIAPIMVPHVAKRPVTLQRFHDGIDKPGFFQKNVVKGFPKWLKRVEVRKKEGTVHHPIVTDARSLVWLAQQNSITPHVWTSRAPRVMYPDICVFDLDPSDAEQKRLRDAALLVRALLKEAGFESWIKTSGSKGYHVAVPLDGKTKYGDVARFAHTIGEEAVRRDPKNLTREFHKVDRGKRVLVDTGRNEYSATFAAAYAVRARDGAPISAPVKWTEVEKGTVNPTAFTIRNITERIEHVGDLWADMLERPASLSRFRAS